MKIHAYLSLESEWFGPDPDKFAGYNKITHLMRLKHLEVEVEVPSAASLCPFQGEIVEWIQSGEFSQLQSLHVGNPHFLSELFNSGTPLKLPQLEVLNIPSVVGEEEVSRKC